jgi:uncharacterized protein (TIGR00297 family)
MTVAIVFILYAVTILSLRYLKSGSERYRYIIRKSVHLATGLVLFFLTYHFNKQTILMLISAGTVFSIVTYRIKKLDFIHTTSGSSLGTLFYPIGLLTSFILLYHMPVYYFRLTLMILSLSDTAANLCGEIKRWNFRFTILKESKSILGVAGFACSAFMLHVILLPMPRSGVYSYILLSVIAAINFEVISFRGSDNFTLPAGCSLFFILTYNTDADSIMLIMMILLLAAGSIMLYKKNILTRYGSIAAYLLGIFFFCLPGYAWSVPVIAFFITSVVFTKINGYVNRKNEETNRRNIWQVFANILFAVASSAGYLITGDEIFIYFYIALIATVTSDTWASEIGPVFAKRCFSIADLEFKNSGTSGGVSLPGTAAAFTGSLMISLLSYYLFFNAIDTAMVLLIALAGFAAMFVDSLLSAFLEPVLLKTEFFKKEPGPDSPAPNDIVNLAGSLTAPVFFLLFRMLI